MRDERLPAGARSAKAGRSDYQLLTRLFLRQFLENDLVSPDADRSQLIAVVGAGVISLTRLPRPKAFSARAWSWASAFVGRMQRAVLGRTGARAASAMGAW